MTVHDEKLYLIHIQECLTRIEQYTEEGKEAFFRDNKTQDAVLRNLHTLAESTQRISGSLKETQPDIDWNSIAGFRNVVVHDYLGIDLEQIWDIVEHDLLPLKRAVAGMLKRLGGPGVEKNDLEK